MARSKENKKKFIQAVSKLKHGEIVPTIGCENCRVQWNHYCQLCKAKGKIRDSSRVRKKLRALGYLEHPKKEKSKTQIEAGFENIIDKPVKSIKKGHDITNFFIQSFGIFEEISEIPPDFYGFFASKRSLYYTNNDKSILIRSSDHWGTDIAKCIWFLKGYPQMSCWRWKKQYEGRFLIGMIRFDELTAVKEKK